MGLGVELGWSLVGGVVVAGTASALTWVALGEGGGRGVELEVGGFAVELLFGVSWRFA